jgi:hypothetical protein
MSLLPERPGGFREGIVSASHAGEQSPMLYSLIRATMKGINLGTKLTLSESPIMSRPLFLGPLEGVLIFLKRTSYPDFWRS